MNDQSASVLLISKNTHLTIKNSVAIDIETLFDSKEEMQSFLSIDSSIENEVQLNQVDWIVYDLHTEDSDEKKMLFFNSYLPRHLYQKYSNVNFIFLSNGNVFGDNDWNESTEIDRHSPIQYYGKTISAGEIYEERVWTLRFDLYDRNMININFENDKVYYGAIDKKYTMITKSSLSSIINALIENYKDFRESSYHIVPKDTQTEYQIMHYNAWTSNKKPYIERSTSANPINHILKTCKPKEIEKLWKSAGFEDIPSFKEMFDNM